MTATSRVTAVAARPMDVSDFEGHWRIARKIFDGEAAGESARLHGTASLERRGDHWVWCETGALSFTGRAPMTAERRYLWRPAPGAIEVAFEDGRPFHTLALGGEQAQVLHRCAPDTYAGTYLFGDWPTWRLIWRVTGPRKDYRSVTVFRREAAGP